MRAISLEGSGLAQVLYTPFPTPMAKMCKRVGLKAVMTGMSTRVPPMRLKASDGVAGESRKRTVV